MRAGGWIVAIPKRQVRRSDGQTMRTSTQEKPASPTGKYVVYDPPADGLPYVAVLFLPEQKPRAFLFHTADEAEAFLTSHAHVRSR